MAERPEFAACYPNLAEPRDGAAIVSVSDEFFAPAKRMLQAGEPRFCPDRYDDHGKWMDGWESRRRRDEGHDSCVVRIRPGVVHGVEIDTRYFTGNFAPAASLESCRVDTDPEAATRWTRQLDRVRLAGDRRHFFPVENPCLATHLRLHIFPDGGVARLRVFGAPDPALGGGETAGLTDLASTAVGGRAVHCNDMHFGHMANIISPGPPANMGDGWETRRRREPGNDWLILALGRAGRIARAEVDTAFFKGNHPVRCALRGSAEEPPADARHTSARWPVILPPMALGPDQLHVFEHQISDAGPVRYVRFDIYPDGGVARLRLFGIPAEGRP